MLSLLEIKFYNFFNLFFMKLFYIYNLGCEFNNLIRYWSFFFNYFFIFTIQH